ncbi:MAG TPA: lytic transglycosylase domain-containing protein [Candidatus Paceibacterota bacterium]
MKFIATLIAALVLLPGVSFAQETGSVPPPAYDSFYQTPPTIVDGEVTSGGLVPCSGEGCRTCDFVVLANTIISWLVSIFFLLFAVICLISGFRLVTSGGNQAAKNAAKKSFTNAFIGLMILFVAWLIVDTVMRELLQNEGTIEGWGPWSQIQCSQQTAASIDENFWSAEVRQTATGDEQSELAPGAINSRIAAIESSGSITSMANAALDSVGITDPMQRNAYRGLISQESSNCQNKVGPSTRYGRAYGCTQMLVGTARAMDRLVGNRFSGLTDAQVAERLQNDNAYSIQLGAMYYKQGLTKYGGNVDYALARYNGGDKALESSTRCPGQRSYQCTLNSGYAQTRNYVSNIKAIANGLGS